MINTLISVCMLTYNQKKYVSSAIEGVINQKTTFPFEIIIHDDCSTDGTREIVKDYALKYPNKIKLILPETNQYLLGVDMFDKCMQIASGKYIAWCEGDDLWVDNNKLQLEVDYLEKHPECTLVYTNLDIYYEKTNTIVKDALTNGNIIPPKNFFSLLKRAGFLAPLTWVFRSNFYIPNTIRDRDWSYSIALDMFAQGEVHFIDKTTALYRIFKESVSNSQTILQLFNFGKGIIDTKLKYIERYKNILTTKQINDVILYSYRKYLPGAIVCNDIDFLNKTIEKETLNNKKFIPFLIRIRNLIFLPQIIRLLYKFKGRK